MHKIDMHVHTSETSRCGKVPGREAVRMYKAAGYRGIVITDHYYKEYFERLGDKPWEEKIDHFLAGYREALEEAQSMEFTVLLGMEIRFEENANDYLVYGIDEEFLKSHPCLYDLGLEEFKKMVKGQGILIYQAHPFRPGMNPAAPSLLDGIEVFNGNPRHNSNNPAAREYALASGLKILSGSDFHQVQDLALGGMVVPDVPQNPRELVKLLEKGEMLELIET